MFGTAVSRAAFGALRSTARPAVLATRPGAAFTAPLGARRGYAEAVSDKLHLSLILPHSVRRRHHCVYCSPLTLFSGPLRRRGNPSQYFLVGIIVWDICSALICLFCSASGEMGILACE